MARPVSDEGFHEIQLSGKQLVFLFMATTVVSVIIFLCGVLVGRGARLQSGSQFAALAGLGDVGLENREREVDVSTAGSTEGVEEVAAPSTGTEALSYHRRLQGDAAPAEALQIPEAKPVPRPGRTADVVPASPPVSAVASAPSTAAAKRPSSGYTVQVAALRNLTQADAMVGRLTGKGYPAYVLAPQTGAPANIYRVRIGSYPDRRAAQQVVRRLETEEKFKPWITR